MACTKIPIIALVLFLVCTESRAALAPIYAFPLAYERIRVISAQHKAANTRGLFYLKQVDYKKLRGDDCIEIFSAHIQSIAAEATGLEANEVFHIRYQFSKNVCPGPQREEPQLLEGGGVRFLTLNCDSKRECTPSSVSHFAFTDDAIHLELERRRNRVQGLLERKEYLDEHQVLMLEKLLLEP
jgi:hypothetical protein